MRSLDPTEDLAIALVRRFLVLCEHPRTRDRMLRLVVWAPTAGEQAPRLLRWLNRALMLPRRRRRTRPVSAVKWELIAGQFFALATARYILELEPLASADFDDVVAAAAPGVLGVLQGPDRMFTALIIDEDEDLSDIGDLSDIADIDVEDELPSGTPSRRRSRWRRTERAVESGD